MNTFLLLLLAFAISAGQLIRIPLATGGVIFLDIIIALLCLRGLVRLKFKLKKPPKQIIVTLLFVAVATVSLILTPLDLKFPEYLISFLYTVRFLLYVLFAWVTFSGAKSDLAGVFGDLKKNIPKVFLLSGISFAVLGLLQFIFFPNLEYLASLGWDPHYFRTVSTFFDPNFAGAFFVLTLLLLTFHLGGDLDRTPREFYVFFIIIYVALLTTFSRSSYLMFLTSGIVFSFLKKSKIIFLVVLILFLVLMLGFNIYSQVIAKPKNIDREQSASLRHNSWQQGLTLFQKSPILGVGFNAYRYGIRQYNLGGDQFLQSHGSSSNDSSLLYVLSTTGIVGLIIYLFFLWSLRKQNLILTAGIAGLIAHSLFANSLFYPPVLAWLLLISVGENSFISVTSKK